MDSTNFGRDDQSDDQNYDSSFLVVDDPHPDVLRTNSHYEIVEEIGRGGSGIVYRAKDLDLQRHVAIKLLYSSLSDRPETIQRFVKEAFVMGALQHPGIAHVFECGFTECGRPFTVMKLVEGESFDQLLSEKEGKEENFESLFSIFRKVCNTVAYVHSQGVLHLDLKPANIMVGSFGEVYIMDWGLSRALEELETIQQVDGASKPQLSHAAQMRRLTGTPKYMAPEQANVKTVDMQTDVFALGAILCRILTGRAPYTGETQHEIIQKAQKADLTEAIDVLDSCNQNRILVQLAKRCLQANRLDRPRSAKVVADEVFRQRVANAQRAQHDMRHFFEISQDLFCILSLERTVIRVNENFSRILGQGESKLLGRPFTDIFTENDRHAAETVLSSILDGQPEAKFESTCVSTDGAKTTFQWTAKLLIEEGVILLVGRQIPR